MKVTILLSAFCCFVFSPFVVAQQADVAFGVGTVVAPSANSASNNSSLQSMTGGTYLGFSADVLFLHNFGVEGEVSWRASQGQYYGYQPYRPIFYDVNAIYAPKLGKYAQLELLGGLGGLTTRFYTPYYNNCTYYNCTNYFSSNHFMGDVGAGLRYLSAARRVSSPRSPGVLHQQ